MHASITDKTKVMWSEQLQIEAYLKDIAAEDALILFEILDDLQHKDGKTIVMVEQNAKKGLAFADLGYVLVSGETAIAGDGDDLLENPDVGRLFLGG